MWNSARKIFFGSPVLRAEGVSKKNPYFFILNFFVLVCVLFSTSLANALPCGTYTTLYGTYCGIPATSSMTGCASCSYACVFTPVGVCGSGGYNDYSCTCVSTPTPSPTPIPTPSPSPTPTPVPASITIYQASPFTVVTAPGQSFSITFNWYATTPFPTGNPSPWSNSYAALVHFSYLSTGNIVTDTNTGMPYQGDFIPSPGTDTWTGIQATTLTSTVPTGVPPGNYNIYIGLYNNYTGPRLTLTQGPGVITDGSQRYLVGVLSVGLGAPTPMPTPVPTAPPVPTPTPSSCFDWGGSGRQCVNDSQCCSNYHCAIAGNQPVRMYPGAPLDSVNTWGVKWTNNLPSGGNDLLLSSSPGGAGGTPITVYTGPTRFCMPNSYLPPYGYATPLNAASASHFNPSAVLDTSGGLAVNRSLLTWNSVDSVFECNLQQFDKYRYRKTSPVPSTTGVMIGCACMQGYEPVMLTTGVYGTYGYNIHLGSPMLNTLWAKVVTAIEDYNVHKALLKISTKVSFTDSALGESCLAAGAMCAVDAYLLPAIHREFNTTRCSANCCSGKFTETTHCNGVSTGDRCSHEATCVEGKRNGASN